MNGRLGATLRAHSSRVASARLLHTSRLATRRAPDSENHFIFNPFQFRCPPLDSTPRDATRVLCFCCAAAASSASASASASAACC